MCGGIASQGAEAARRIESASVGLPKNVIDRRVELKRESGKTIEKRKNQKTILWFDVCRLELERPVWRQNLAGSILLYNSLQTPPPRVLSPAGVVPRLFDMLGRPASAALEQGKFDTLSFKSLATETCHRHVELQNEQLTLQILGRNVLRRRHCYASCRS